MEQICTLRLVDSPSSGILIFVFVAGVTEALRDDVADVRVDVRAGIFECDDVKIPVLRCCLTRSSPSCVLRCGMRIVKNDCAGVFILFWLERD